jgi:hypothetical protein
MPGFSGEDIVTQTCVILPLTAASIRILITQIGVIKPDATAGRGFKARDPKKEQEYARCKSSAPRFPS